MLPQLDSFDDVQCEEVYRDDVFREVSFADNSVRPVSLTARIDAMESPAREAFREAYDLFADALVIPNEWLPARLRNRKAGGATPATIFRNQQSRIERKVQRESAHAALKAEKELRLRRYQSSCDHPDGIEYDVSNEALIRQAERAFARMLNIRPD